MNVPGERVELTAVTGGGGRPDALVRAAFDLAADGIAVLDTRQSAVRISFANTTLALALNMERASLSGQTLRSLFDSADADRAELAARAAVQSDDMQRTEARIYTRDGFPWWAQIVLRRLSGTDTEGLCLATFCDISTRKYLDDATASLPITMLILDRDLAIRWINPLAAQSFGREPQSMIGQLITTVVPETLARRPYYERVLAGESLDLEPVAFTARPGVTRILASSLRPLPGRDGSVQGIFVAGIDAGDMVRSQQHMELALRAANIGIWEFDVASGMPEFDARSREILGFSEQDWRDKPGLWSSRIHPEDREQIQRAGALVISGATSMYDEEFRFRHREGHWIWIHGRCRALERDAGGRALRLIGTAADVSAQRAASDGARRTASTLRAMTEHAPDRLLLLDRDGRIQFANRMIRGHEPAALAGLNAFELLDAAVREPLRQLCAAALANRTPAFAESNELDTGGTRHFFEYHAAPVLEAGTATGLSIRITDVTQLKQSEELLRTQARILATMREAVLLIARDCHIRYANNAAAALFGFSADELVALQLSDLGLPCAVLDPTTDPRPVHADGIPQEWLGRRRDGTEFVVEALFTMVEIQSEPMIIGVFQDVTESRQLERSILDATNFEQQRISSDLHDGLGQELTGISLMLRSCATRIGREYPAGQPLVEEIIGLVDNAVDSARSLTRGFSPRQLAHGGLPAVLEDLAERVRHVYGIRVNFHQALRAPLRIDASAANHLFRIAQEAAFNAVRHGHATLVTLRLVVDPGQVTLEVLANGSGTTPGRDGAAGIGLRIMEYRARLLGGELSSVTPPRGGTALCCTCPQPDDAPPAAPTGPAASGAA